MAPRIRRLNADRINTFFFAYFHGSGGLCRCSLHELGGDQWHALAFVSRGLCGTPRDSQSRSVSLSIYYPSP